MNIKKITTMIIFLALSIQAEAKDILYTPPLSPYGITDGEDGFYCQVLNINKAPRRVILEIYNSAGEQIGSKNEFVNPNTIMFLSGKDRLTQFCKITVVNGTKADIRASASIYTTTGELGDKVSIVAQ
jgi:hypothetical protein